MQQVMLLANQAVVQYHGRALHMHSVRSTDVIICVSVPLNINTHMNVLGSTMMIADC
jgi:hypothetical protein